jgi:hypothetical protein
LATAESLIIDDLIDDLFGPLFSTTFRADAPIFA